MPAYVIYQCEVTDPERYAEYRAKVNENPPPQDVSSCGAVRWSPSRATSPRAAR
jgi:hypothetical protein